MAIVTCTNCQSQLELDDSYLGREVRCGGCNNVFVARPTGARAEPEPVVQPIPRYDLAEWDERPRRVNRRDQVAARLYVPSILLTISGFLGIVGYMADFGFRVVNFGQPPPQIFGPPPPGQRQAQQMGEKIGEVGGFVYDFVGIGLSVVVIIGAGSMRSVEGYGMAMAAAIFSAIPIPCGGCCCFSPPFGIWALVILMEPGVKAAFAATVSRESS